MSTKVIQYSRYRILKDSIIFMNIYGIFHDPEMYDDPEMFDPERYVMMPFGTKEGVDEFTLVVQFQKRRFWNGRPGPLLLCQGKPFLSWLAS